MCVCVCACLAVCAVLNMNRLCTHVVAKGNVVEGGEGGVVEGARQHHVLEEGEVVVLVNLLQHRLVANGHNLRIERMGVFTLGTGVFSSMPCFLSSGRGKVRKGCGSIRVSDELALVRNGR